jgi:hypothetical protein
MASMLDAYGLALRTCEPYLVATDLSREGMSLRPLGVQFSPRNVLDPHDLGTAPFLNLVQRLDELAYGPRGMSMPRWVFYDCAEMVGGLFGLGRQAATLPDWARAALGVDRGYSGLVPVSLFVLVPMLVPGAFLGYTLCSANQVAPGVAPAGLRLLTAAMGMRVFPVRTLYATTQWRSPTLAIHARFAPLDLLTAYTPAHTLPATLTFRFEASDDRIAAALAGGESRTPAEAAAGAPGPRLLDADDEEEMREIQAEIEAGARWSVVGPPVREGAATLVPLART